MTRWSARTRARILASYLRPAILVAVALCAATQSACATSASLALKGRFPEACQHAQDETDDEQQGLRERLLAHIRPSLRIEFVDAEQVEKKAGVPLQLEARFARVTVGFEGRPDFDVDLRVAEIYDQSRGFSAARVDEYLAARLVLPPPEEPDGAVAALVGMFKLLAFVSCLVINSRECVDAVLGAGDRARRYTIARVDEEPALRPAKERLMAMSNRRSALVALLDDPGVVREPPSIDLIIKASFGAGSEECTLYQRVVVRVPGHHILEDAEREFGPRSRSLHEFDLVLLAEDPPSAD